MHIMSSAHKRACQGTPALPQRTSLACASVAPLDCVGLRIIEGGGALPSDCLGASQPQGIAERSLLLAKHHSQGLRGGKGEALWEDPGATRRGHKRRPGRGVTRSQAVQAPSTAGKATNAVVSRLQPCREQAARGVIQHLINGQCIGNCVRDGQALLERHGAGLVLQKLGGFNKSGRDAKVKCECIRQLAAGAACASSAMLGVSPEDAQKASRAHIGEAERDRVVERK